MTDNATLAKRIVELDRELSLTKDLLESSMLSEATAKQYAEEVDKQNKELAATVKALQKALSDAVAAFRQYELSVDDYPTIKHKLFMQALNDELETTPQQHLAEIRAEAALEGFIAGYEFCLSTLPSPYSNLIAVNYRGMAERYAESIRQGVK